MKMYLGSSLPYSEYTKRTNGKMGGGKVGDGKRKSRSKKAGEE